MENKYNSGKFSSHAMIYDYHHIKKGCFRNKLPLAYNEVPSNKR
jgi:hypothetical protein